MVNIIRKVGHIVKHSPGIIRRNILISKLKHQTDFKKIERSENREPQIIVSLTSYKKRFKTLDICIKSILNQNFMPDRLILYLSKNEKREDLPNSVINLEKYGLEIKFVDLDLKPHKKYYYAMKEFPNDIVITVDDDVIYSRDLIKNLVNTYNKYPNCVIAARAHRIIFSNNKIKKYSEWDQCSNESYKPSYMFLATGVGGVLYPPHLLNLQFLLNLKYIKKYITVDDLWLKMAEIKSNVPTVICDSDVDRKRIAIPSAQKIGLANQNVGENKNDYYLNLLNQDFNMFYELKKAEKN